MSDYGWKWNIWSMKNAEYYTDPLLGKSLRGTKKLVAKSEKAFWFESRCRRDGEKAMQDLQRKLPNNGPYELEVYEDEDPRTTQFYKDVQDLIDSGL